MLRWTLQDTFEFVFHTNTKRVFRRTYSDGRSDNKSLTWRHRVYNNKYMITYNRYEGIRLFGERGLSILKKQTHVSLVRRTRPFSRVKIHEWSFYRMAFFAEKPNPFFLPNGVTFPVIIILEMQNMQTFVSPVEVCSIFSLLENY